MTAVTFAVQSDIAGRLVIDVVIGPVTTRMTARTGVRAAFVTGCNADQCVGRAVMTGRAAAMNLRITAAGEGGCRIDVTDQTIGFTGDITGGDVIDTMICCRCLVGMTGGAGGRAAAGNSGLDISQWRRCRAVVGMAAGTVV